MVADPQPLGFGLFKALNLTFVKENPLCSAPVIGGSRRQTDFPKASTPDLQEVFTAILLQLHHN